MILIDSLIKMSASLIRDLTSKLKSEYVISGQYKPTSVGRGLDCDIKILPDFLESDYDEETICIGEFVSRTQGLFIQKGRCTFFIRDKNSHAPVYRIPQRLRYKIDLEDTETLAEYNIQQKEEVQLFDGDLLIFGRGYQFEFVSYYNPNAKENELKRKEDFEKSFREKLTEY